MYGRPLKQALSSNGRGLPGITLIEVLIIISVVVVLIRVVGSLLDDQLKKTWMHQETQEVVNTMRSYQQLAIAQQKSVAFRFNPTYCDGYYDPSCTLNRNYSIVIDGATIDRFFRNQSEIKEINGLTCQDGRMVGCGSERQWILFSPRGNVVGITSNARITLGINDVQFANGRSFSQTSTIVVKPSGLISAEYP